MRLMVEKVHQQREEILSRFHAFHIAIAEWLIQLLVANFLRQGFETGIQSLAQCPQFTDIRCYRLIQPFWFVQRVECR
jgi:hypothetical protein